MELEVNFKDISNEMTNILEEKNKAYGNSFDLTMDKWGTNVAGARLDDKINRIDGMLQDGNLVKKRRKPIRQFIRPIGIFVFTD